MDTPDVARIAERAREERRLGLDTEFMPEGRYRPRVHLASERRTIVLPNPIRVDVTPPQIELRSLRPRVFSPDGDR